MEFNDGSQYRIVSNPAAYASQRDLFMFRAVSAKNGSSLYVDSAFAQHRRTMAGLRGLVMYAFVWQNAGTPEDQARYFLNTINNGLATNEMVMIDLEESSGITDPVSFLRRWCAVVEPALDTRAWVYVPSFYEAQLTRAVTQDRIIMAPRYSRTPNRGLAPGWPYDVHQYTDQGYFPGCTQSGDVSYTELTTEQMLAKCNINGTTNPYSH